MHANAVKGADYGSRYLLVIRGVYEDFINDLEEAWNEADGLLLQLFCARVINPLQSAFSLH